MSITSAQVAASFAGVAFGIIQSEGAAILGSPITRNYAVTDVNYGADTYIQDLGQKSVEQTIDCLIPLGNWTAFQGKSGASGTLSTASGYSRSAYLADIASFFVHTDLDYVHASVKWVIR